MLNNYLAWSGIDHITLEQNGISDKLHRQEEEHARALIAEMGFQPQHVCISDELGRWLELVLEAAKTNEDADRELIHADMNPAEHIIGEAGIAANDHRLPQLVE